MAKTKIGLAANRPPSMSNGGRYVARDTNQEWVWDGSEWVEVTSAGGGGGIEYVGEVRVVADGDVDLTAGSTSATAIAVPELEIDVTGDGARDVRIDVVIPGLGMSLPNDSLQSIGFAVTDGVEVHKLALIERQRLDTAAAGEAAAGGGSIQEVFQSHVIIPAYNGEKTWALVGWSEQDLVNIYWYPGSYGGPLSISAYLL